jgi:hypothetical protein
VPHLIWLFTPYSSFLYTICWMKASPILSTSHLFVTDVLEVVACQGQKFYIFRILISNFHSCSKCPVINCFNRHGNTSLFSVPYLVPCDVSLQVFIMVLHVAFVGWKYAASSGCVRCVDLGGRHTNQISFS